MFSRKTSRNETILEDNTKMNLTETELECVETTEVCQNKKQSQIYEGGNEHSASKKTVNFLPNGILTFKETPFLMKLLFAEVSYK
jgi:hypothetical protein